MSSQALAEKVVQKMMADDAFSRWLKISVVEIKPGYASVKMTVRKEMLNGFFVAHGGITFSLADSAFAFAANTHGRVSVAIDNSMSYPAPVYEGDVLTAVAEEQSASNRLAVYNVTVSKQDNTKVGLFRGTVYRTSKEFFPEDVKHEHKK